MKIRFEFEIDADAFELDKVVKALINNETADLSLWNNHSGDLHGIAIEVQKCVKAQLIETVDNYMTEESE